MIQVTEPFFPPLAEYQAFLEGIWSRRWLTNNGELVIDLESRLKAFLGVEHLVYMTNGTITLQALLQSIGRKGKILTTPFSYIATTSAILWEGFEPVFVDVDPHTFNADPAHAEALIDGDTVGACITHCFGVPCNVDGWEKLSTEYGIPIIYDAAHAFAVKVNGRSVLDYGYGSSLSFHATKLFHTVEGGAVVVPSAGLAREMQLRRNFGHDGPERFSEVGVNGKNSELHAAMGLLNLRYVEDILRTRRQQYEYYKAGLSDAGRGLTFQSIGPEVTYNFSYFPVLLPDEQALLHTQQALLANNISPRRYFYPALNALPFTKQYPADTPIAANVASRILCLPMFHTLTRGQQDRVIEIVTKA